jgi:(E)-4-hydroxy-3-methyl-but-2-enyl pyrophosphate reductase
MKVICAKYMGFCPGVKRAWKLVEETNQNRKKPVYILGELIHNQQAINRLNEWGIKTINGLNEVQNKKGIVIIRAHGEPPQTYQKLKNLNLKFIDTTCPNVIKIQKLAKQLSDEGFFIVVSGKKDHPEPKATLGHAKEGLIVDSDNDAKKISPMEKIGLLSQTTFSPVIFEKIRQILKKRTKEFKSVETFCQITQMAQKEAQKIAKKVDLMIVVGGKHSSNTQKLVEVCQKITPTYHIETVREIKKAWLEKEKIGLTAGASTPEWVIKEIQLRLKEGPASA